MEPLVLVSEAAHHLILHAGTCTKTHKHYHSNENKIPSILFCVAMTTVEPLYSEHYSGMKFSLYNNRGGLIPGQVDVCYKAHLSEVALMKGWPL